MAGVNWGNVGSLLIIAFAVAGMVALIGPTVAGMKGNFKKIATAVAVLTIAGMAFSLFLTGSWLGLFSGFLSFIGIGNGGTVASFVPQAPAPK